MHIDPLNLSQPEADVFVPDGVPVEQALARTTHLAVGAHQDDLEFMALHGILECYDRDDRWFTGVTVTDGAGSPRSGPFADVSNAEMREIRVREQREAASLGSYSCQIQLMFSSSAIKDAAQIEPVSDLRAILELTQSQVAYLHNPADKHDTHVACCVRTLEALRALAAGSRPDKVLGCEVWRNLDWLLDTDKQALALADPSDLGTTLARVFQSQIAGGKRYDRAVHARQLANATFHQAHEVDRHEGLAFAMDLTPLIIDPTLDIGDYTLDHLQRTQKDIADRISRVNRSET